MPNKTQRLDVLRPTAGKNRGRPRDNAQPDHDQETGRKVSVKRATLTPEQHLAASEPKFAALIARSRPYAVQPGNLVRPFDALAESIVYQQLSGKAAATIFGLVRALYPRRKWLSPELIIATPDERFRSAGLSRAKTAALKDLAAKTLDGTVPSSVFAARSLNAAVLARERPALRNLSSGVAMIRSGESHFRRG